VFIIAVFLWKYWLFQFLFVALKVSRLRRLQTGIRVRGVAQLDGLMYVICDSNTLLVYDSVSFVPLKKVLVQLKGRKSSHFNDITACSINHCLYVTGRNNRCILRLTSVVRDVVKWLDICAWVTKHVMYILSKYNKYNTEIHLLFLRLIILKCGSFFRVFTCRSNQDSIYVRL